jgi:hypothetical protein
MPIERRQIIFSEGEVLQAIESYRRTHTDFLPHGEVTGITLKPATGHVGVHLTISVGMIYGQTRHAVSIEAAEVAIVELLIRCCLENNIPIPKIGRKSAGVIDGMLMLSIASTSEAADGSVPHSPRRHNGVPATAV